MTFSFRPQKALGDVGEQKLLQTYQNVIQTDGRISDFILTTHAGPKTVELKTDSYSMNATPNLFMEYYGNTEKATLGGPWRAAKDKVDYFVYLYLTDGEFFWYETKSLVAFLDGWIKGKKTKTIKNRSYETTGFIVPRQDVEHLRVTEPARKNPTNPPHETAP